MVKKRPISSTLINMEKGGVEVFPLNQRDSVVSSISRQRFKNPGRKWTISTDANNKEVSVVRVK